MDSQAVQPLIAGQAPGTIAHETGIPCNDKSGDRLRDWLGMTREESYHKPMVAIVPMGFCYPGRLPGGGDRPPRPECAKLWRCKLLALVPDPRLTLRVGTYAQVAAPGPGAVTDRMRRSADFLPTFFRRCGKPSRRRWPGVADQRRGTLLPVPRPDTRSPFAGVRTFLRVRRSAVVMNRHGVGESRGLRATLAIVRRLAVAWLRDRHQFARRRVPRSCPICRHHGVFVSVGHPPRWDARCPQCGSRERHRLMQLWVTEGGGDRLAGKRILHFAPEREVMRRMRDNPLYQTADLHQKGVTHRIDITRAPLPDAAYDVVIAHHVLEHIDDDRLAMRELFRLLQPGGVAVLSVPINASRRWTYENAAMTTPELRFAHFSAEDHKRYYGLDFADRLAEAGFSVSCFRMTPEQEVRYGLLRDEWITIARKPIAPN